MFGSLKEKLNKVIKSFSDEEVKDDEKDDKGIDISTSTKVKSIFSNKIKLNKKDIDSFLDKLKMILLQSDVSLDVAESIIDEMKVELENSEFDKKNTSSEIYDVFKKSMMRTLDSKGFDLINYISNEVKSGKKPFKILFLGFNGTGKTTTIAKIAHKLKEDELTSVLSASDTFRAAAIEQLDYHANKIGLPIIKGKYGSDPASIAFDAVAYARSHGLDCVLIDTSGRQESNQNLMKELQKIYRINQPDLTIFVGESISGRDLADRINEFKNFIKIDGIIMTKLDCDAKGGNIISIYKETQLPVFMIGVGEKYDDLINYEPEEVIKLILG